MAKYVANVDINTETFGQWVVRTNDLLHALSTEIVTANTLTGITGNTSTPRLAQVIGTMAANTLAATTLTGGNTTSSANLAVSSNVNIANVTLTSAANSLYTNTQFFTANVQSNGALVAVYGTTLNVSSNLVVTSVSQQLKSNSSVVALGIASNGTVTNTSIGGTNLSVAANTIISGSTLQSTSNVDISSSNVVITAVSQQLKSNNTVTAIGINNNGSVTNTTVSGTNLVVTANAVITGVNHTIAGNVNIDSGVLYVDSVNNRVGFGNTTPDATVTIQGNSNTSGTIWVGTAANLANTTVTGFINVSSSANVAGNLRVGGNSTFVGLVTLPSQVAFTQDYIVDVVSNSNIGNTSAQRVIYSFPKASYRSGKMMVFANNNNGVANVNQIAEMVVAHDGVNDAYVTVYGVVASPSDAGNTTSPLGVFSAQINNSNVEILMTQSYSNSAVKVVAHLIK